MTCGTNEKNLYLGLYKGDIKTCNNTTNKSEKENMREEEEKQFIKL